MRGIRVTARGLTALEAAVALPDGSAFLDRALQRHAPFDEVYGAYCRAIGRRDSAAVRPSRTELGDHGRLGWLGWAGRGER